MRLNFGQMANLGYMIAFALPNQPPALGRHSAYILKKSLS
jgi:hypothetical protein